MFKIVSTKWDRGDTELKSITLMLRDEIDTIEIKYSIKDDIKVLIEKNDFFGCYDPDEIFSRLTQIWEENNKKFLKILKTKQDIISILRG